MSVGPNPTIAVAEDGVDAIEVEQRRIRVASVPVGVVGHERCKRGERPLNPSND